jgi:hypothetical protein
MGDHTEALAEEEEHLRVPIVRAQRPTVTKDDGLSFTPVFVIDVDVFSILFPSSYVWHNDFLSVDFAHEMCRP